MNFKKMTKKLLLSLIVLLAVFALVGCGGDDEGDLYTYNTYTAISPSNWNELTYQDNNDTQIMNYIGSSFFSYNFKYDEKGEILPGEFVMEYSAATALEDVTEEYVGEEWGIPEGATAVMTDDIIAYRDGTNNTGCIGFWDENQNFISAVPETVIPCGSKADNSHRWRNALTLEIPENAKYMRACWEAVVDAYVHQSTGNSTMLTQPLLYWIY